MKRILLILCIILLTMSFCGNAISVYAEDSREQRSIQLINKVSVTRGDQTVIYNDGFGLEVYFENGLNIEYCVATYRLPNKEEREVRLNRASNNIFLANFISDELGSWELISILVEDKDGNQSLTKDIENGGNFQLDGGNIEVYDPEVVEPLVTNMILSKKVIDQTMAQSISFEIKYSQLFESGSIQYKTPNGKVESYNFRTDEYGKNVANIYTNLEYYTYGKWEAIGITINKTNGQSIEYLDKDYYGDLGNVQLDDGNFEKLDKFNSSTRIENLYIENSIVKPNDYQNITFEVENSILVENISIKYYVEELNLYRSYTFNNNGNGVFECNIETKDCLGLWEANEVTIKRRSGSIIKWNSYTSSSINGIPFSNLDFTVRYLKGDINKDGKVNALDLSLLAALYNISSESSEYDSFYDLNEDNIIDIYDIVILSKNIDNSGLITSDEIRKFDGLISAGTSTSFRINDDKTISAYGYNEFNQCDVLEWSNIVKVAGGYYHTVGLKADGTVVAAGSSAHGATDVSSWRDIVQVSAGESHTVGLTSNGIVRGTGCNCKGESRINTESDIIQIEAGYHNTVVLKKDGTVELFGDNCYGFINSSEWTDIIQISVGYGHIVGLKSNGTVIQSGYTTSGKTEVLDFKNIVQVKAGYGYTVCLKADGTVEIFYNDKYRKIKGLSNIVNISMKMNHFLALKSDGTILAVGDNSYGQCDISEESIEYLEIKGITKDLYTIAEVINDKYGDTINSGYISTLINQGFYEKFEDVKAVEYPIFNNVNLIVDIKWLNDICETIDKNIVLYKDTTDTRYLENIKVKLNDIKEFYYYLEKV